MKILWLYKYLSKYDFDNWLHLKFAEAIKRYPGVQLMAYGPGIHQGYSALTDLPYDPTHTMYDIKKVFPYDVAIINTKSRMFDDYNPHLEKAHGPWLPKDFSQTNVPKIVIEEDYHYERNDQWYVDEHIDLILQRHWSQARRQQTVPMQWFPFSVDTNVFKPGGKRQTRICFAGSINNDAYRPRNHAVDCLRRHGLIDVFAKQEKVGDRYVQCLQSYIAHLSCSSIFKLSSAKMFEIMASGSALFTNGNDDLKELFPDRSYYTYETGNTVDILKTARRILNDKIEREVFVRTGLEAIRTRHTHEIRIGQLLKIIEQLQGK